MLLPQYVNTSNVSCFCGREVLGAMIHLWRWRHTTRQLTHSSSITWFFWGGEVHGRQATLGAWNRFWPLTSRMPRHTFCVLSWNVWNQHTRHASA